MVNHGYRWAIALATNGMPFPPNCLIRLDNRQKEIGGEGGIRTLGEFNEINKVKTVWAILGRWRSFDAADIHRLGFQLTHDQSVPGFGFIPGMPAPRIIVDHEMVF